MFLVKTLADEMLEFDSLPEAEKRFYNFPNSVAIFFNNASGKTEVLKKRSHKEVGMIEINNKCVYLKVPFYEPSDMPKIKISKIGETPDKLKSKMDVIDEMWF